VRFFPISKIEYQLNLHFLATGRFCRPSLEKDYWIMHVLWALQEGGMIYELKGGTSLSKGWGIIHRFSEDVDIKILPPMGMTVYTGKNHSKPKHRASRQQYFDWLQNSLKIPGCSYIRRDPGFDDRALRNVGYRIGYSSK
jgi:hypothetical protein